MRLIDADALKRRAITVRFFGKDIMMVPTAEIDDAPTIDAVEVVRCKECRYFKKIVERSDSGLCYRDLVASAWKENGYCSRGERREDDEA